ncbi:gpW family head-tail joining protein [Photobacterium leiognathi]|uniref:gpW family head-tail joining protein n=1 Tax=Photobacterium leiognathi TaxID=553611 RepID=UPI00020880C5|nr:gpW family head-tail joining protein [Photobacterium leiognathi]PSW48344.1 phage tail protein [Photobacterium leiognathi subsp. mandapamensis]GAA03221.1 gpW family protein [Photobacterium leiognathi subsp. mandapamensis svers.1.1.]
MNTLQQRLKEAEEAYHNLQTGQMAVSINKDGRQVEFNRANIDKLKQYIEDLRTQLGLMGRRRRPAGVMC